MLISMCIDIQIKNAMCYKIYIIAGFFLFLTLMYGWKLLIFFFLIVFILFLLKSDTELNSDIELNQISIKIKFVQINLLQTVLTACGSLKIFFFMFRLTYCFDYTLHCEYQVFFCRRKSHKVKIVFFFLGIQKYQGLETFLSCQI